MKARMSGEPDPDGTMMLMMIKKEVIMKKKKSNFSDFISLEKGNILLSIIMLPFFIITGWLIYAEFYNYHETQRIFMKLDFNSIFRFMMIASVVCWLWFTYNHIKKRWYNFLTDGRNYGSDHALTRKEYDELIGFYSQSDSHKIHVKTLPEMDWYESNCIPLGKLGKKLIFVPTGGDGYNVIVTGLPSVGKTTAIGIPAAMQFGYAGINQKTGKPRYKGSVFAIDYKGDLSIKTLPCGRNIKFFEPENPEKSCHFNPFRGLEEMDTDFQKCLIENLGHVVFPEDKNSKNDSYWRQTGNDLFCGACFLMLEENPSVTFPEVIDFLCETNVIDLVKKGISSTSDAAKDYLAGYYKNNEKNLSGAFSAMKNHIKSFRMKSISTLFDGKGDCISIDTLDEGYDVYIRVSQENKNLFAPVISVITMQFLDGFKSRSEDKKALKKARPILFLLDELWAMRLDFSFLAEACSTLRSKKIFIIMLLQGLSQLKDLYGEAGASTILGDCQYICSMSVNDLYTRNTMSDLIGSHLLYRESWVVEHQQRKTRSFTEVREKIFQPEDFGHLNDKENDKNYIVIYSFGKYIKAEQCRYYER